MKEGVVNELSFRQGALFDEPAASDDLGAKQLMSTLVVSISEGFRLKYISALRTNKNFSQTEIAPGYSIAKWRNDKGIERDKRVLFASFITAVPYLQTSEHEVKFHGAGAAGLTTCFIANSISLSCLSHPHWGSTELTVEVSRLTETGELVETHEVVRNVSDPSHWKIHSEWILASEIAISSGSDLSDKFTHLFPHLQLGPLALRQMRALSGNERYFAWIIESLRKAESEMANWFQGPFPHAKLPGPATGESETVHRNSKLRELRYFNTGDGRREFMEFHMKNRAEQQRIHYLVDPQNRRLIIGYIGEHLQTAMF